MEHKIMRVLIFLVLVIGLSACAQIPKTRDEFRTAITEGASYHSVSTYLTKHSFDDVTQTLKKKSEECLNFQLNGETGPGPVASSTDGGLNYHATFLKKSNAHAELTVQNIPSKYQTNSDIPKGGFYAIAIDIDRVSVNSTRLTFYGSSDWYILYGVIKSWSDGETAQCPYAYESGSMEKIIFSTS